MSFRPFVSAAVLCATVTRVGTAQPISAPTSSYLGSTTKLVIPYAPGTMLSSVQGGGVTATFRDATGAAMPLQVREMDPSLDPDQPPPANRPYTWATWNRPPASEYDGSYILPVAYTQNATFVRFLLNGPVSVFGFEAEPDLLDASIPMTANFFFNNVLVGSVTRTVNGTGGALLFAYQSGTGIDRVDFSAANSFAIANVRATAVVPEPTTLLLVAAGLTVTGVAARRRRNA